MTPDARRLYRATEITWPPRNAVEAGPWTLRDGGGGGKRVEAATQRATFDPQIDIPAAEQAMGLLQQDALFMVREGEETLDQALAARGYEIIDPVNLYVIRTEVLTDQPTPPVTAFAIWEPLEIMRDIWAKAGIGEARLRVMDRANGPKTALLGRVDDSPAAVAFCACDDDIAMVHALEVLPSHQRKGLGQWMMRAAAHWAADWSVPWLAVLCTQANGPANALYRGLGFHAVGQYHYRIKPKAETPA